MDEQKIAAEYLKLSATVESILVAFSSVYMESGFTHVQYFTKQKSTLIIEHGDLQPKLTNLQSNIHSLFSAHQIHSSH